VYTRAQRAWALDAAGWSQREIAQELGVSQAAVCKILQRAADLAVAQLRDDEARHLVKALNRETYLFREAVRGYERSQQDQTRRRQRQVTDAQGHVLRGVVEVDVLERDGDPRFLDQAGRALERAETLNGLTHDRARPTAHDDADGARHRLASQLDRLAAAVAAAPVARDPQ
jgi:predicted transcriptional regulator